MINGRTVLSGQQNLRLRTGNHTVVFHRPAGQAMREHVHPAWNILVSQAGHITWAAGPGPAQHAPGVIFPPQVAHRAGSSAGHVSVFIDPWYLSLGPGHGRPIPLDLPIVERLRALWSLDGVTDADERARETAAFLRARDLLPQAVPIDPRVAAALRHLSTAEHIPHVAAAVRLSPSRLRALIHEQAGTPPARLRLWQRLRTALHSLQTKPIALAAVDAGFADQAHLTRTATRLLGQTPGELARIVGSATRRHDDERPPALVTAA